MLGIALGIVPGIEPNIALGILTGILKGIAPRISPIKGSIIAPGIEVDLTPRISLESLKGIVLEKVLGKIQCCARDSAGHVDKSST